MGCTIRPSLIITLFVCVATASAAPSAEAAGPGAEPATATAGGPALPTPATLEGLLDRQLAPYGGHPWGAIKAVEQLASGVFHAHMAKRDKRVIFFGDGRSPDDAAYPVGRAVSGAYGAYLGEGRRLRAFLINPIEGRCDPGACRAAVIVRDESKRFLAVSRTPTACLPSEAQTVKLFEGRDSLAVLCSAPIGGADQQRSLTLFHVTEGGLAPVLTADLGVDVTEGGTNDDGVFELCRTPAAGTWRVVSRGAAPVVETFTPSEGRETAEGVHGTRTTWRWSARVGRFVGEGVPHTRTDAPAETCEAD